MSEEEPKRLSIFKDTTPGSIKTLRESYRDRFKFPGRYDFQGELVGQNDRATVILLTSAIDDALAFRIGMSFPFQPLIEETEYIFRFDGPLGTFSARTELAVLFGIIEDETYQELDIIRELRNAAAHSKHPYLFNNPEISNVVIRLANPLGMFPLPDSDKSSDTKLRDFFVIEGMFILQTLLHGSRQKARHYIVDELKKLAEKQTLQPSPDK